MSAIFPKIASWLGLNTDAVAKESMRAWGLSVQKMAVVHYLTVAELQADTTGDARACFIDSVRYLYDAADTTTAGNGSSVVVSADSKRWKAQASGAGDMLGANNLSDLASPVAAYNNLRTRGADIASAGTINLSTATGDLVDVTGTTTITAVTLADGDERTVRFTGILTLTHGANLVLPGAAPILTAPGDFALFRGYAAGLVRCVIYSRADGSPLAGGLGGGGGGSPTAPQGRLTLTSGVPVTVSDVAAATTVYYAPYQGQSVPIWDGTSFVMVGTAGELSQATTDTTKSPAAVGTFGAAVNVPALYDNFVWLDGSTPRCTRGPGWLNSATVTVTIATPAVVTWTAHGLRQGNAVRFTTTGALPTGLAVNTVYYVGKNPTANTFNLSTSVANAHAGIYIATSGGQSGVHTIHNSENVRGTGAGTTELELWKGIWVNKHDIVNGPVARRGTFVGTFGSNATSTVDDTRTRRHLWNAHNRVPRQLLRTGSGTRTASVGGPAEPFLNDATLNVAWVTGIDENPVNARFDVLHFSATAGTVRAGFDLDGTVVVTDGDLYLASNSNSSILTIASAVFSRPAGIGAHYLTPMEQPSSIDSTTFYGTLTGAQYGVSGNVLA